MNVGFEGGRRELLSNDSSIEKGQIDHFYSKVF